MASYEKIRIVGPMGLGAQPFLDDFVISNGVTKTVKVDFTAHLGSVPTTLCMDFMRRKIRNACRPSETLEDRVTSLGKQGQVVLLLIKGMDFLLMGDINSENITEMRQLATEVSGCHIIVFSSLPIELQGFRSVYLTNENLAKFDLTRDDKNGNLVFDNVRYSYETRLPFWNRDLKPNTRHYKFREQPVNFSDVCGDVRFTALRDELLRPEGVKCTKDHLRILLSTQMYVTTWTEDCAYNVCVIPDEQLTAMWSGFTRYVKQALQCRRGKDAVLRGLSVKMMTALNVLLECYNPWNPASAKFSNDAEKCELIKKAYKAEFQREVRKAMDNYTVKFDFKVGVDTVDLFVYGRETNVAFHFEVDMFAADAFRVFHKRADDLLALCKTRFVVVVVAIMMEGDEFGCVDVEVAHCENRSTLNKKVDGVWTGRVAYAALEGDAAAAQPNQLPRNWSSSDADAEPSECQAQDDIGGRGKRKLAADDEIRATAEQRRATEISSSSSESDDDPLSDCTYDYRICYGEGKRSRQNYSYPSTDSDEESLLSD